MAGALDIVTLAEARGFLDFDTSDTSNDVELATFISGVTDVVEAEVGPVVPRAVTAIVRTCGTAEISVPQWPVISITSGAYLDDSSAVDVSKMVADSGVIFMTDGAPFPARPWRLTYQAGLATTPDGIKKGALEVLKLAWATQRGGPEPPAFLISYRAAAWFKPYAPALGFA